MLMIWGRRVYQQAVDEKTLKRRVKNTIMLYAKQKYLENMVTEQLLEKEKNNLVMVEILSHIR